MTQYKLKTNSRSTLNLTTNQINQTSHKSFKLYSLHLGPQVEMTVCTFEHLQWKENGIYNDHLLILEITLEEVALQEPTIDWSSWTILAIHLFE